LAHASRANIGHNSVDGVTVVQVDDLNGLATVGGDCARVTIVGNIDGNDKIVVGMLVTASAI